MSKHPVCYLLILLSFASCTTSNRYFKYVNSAEQAIINNHNKQAIRYYKKAFKSNWGFADHYFNAFKLSTLEKDNNFAKYNAQKLIEKGLCTDIFNAYPVIKNDSVFWNNLIKIKSNKADINYSYREALEAMLYADQVVGREDRDSVDYVFTLNYSKMKPLVAKYGYPSEAKIGITCTSNLKGFYAPPQNLLFFHFMQHGFVGVDSILKTALARKEITPFDYADMICRGKNQTDYCIEPLFMIEDTLYVPRAYNTKKGSLERARKKIGLPSIDMEINVILYKLKNPESDFRLSGSLSYISDIPPEWKKKLFDVYKK